MPSLIFFVAICLTSYCVNGVPSWPMPERVVGFWPLDSESLTNDIVYNMTMYHHNPTLMTSINGPFGHPATSYTVTCNGCPIGHVYDIPLPGAFTVSFFIYTRGKGNGAIITYNSVHSASSGCQFSVSYLEPNYLELWGGPETNKTIMRCSVITPSVWNFFAITYDASAQILSVYNQYGTLLGFVMANVPTPSPSILEFGEKESCGPSRGIQTTDALACVMLYNTTLTPTQISELPYHCQIKGRGTIPPTSTTTTTMAGPIITPWPRPESLLAFWPLNEQYGLNDVSSNRFTGVATSTPPLFAAGPFGDARTALKPRSNDDPKLLAVSNDKLTLNASFTISFFISRGAEAAAGGLFEFQDKYGTPNAFQFRYENETTIEVSAVGNSIGHYTMIQQKGAWTFVAFIYNAANSMFSVYGKHGLFAPGIYASDVRASTAFNNNGIRLGYASRWQQGMRTSDAISCLIIYTTVLTPAEIRQTYDACRIIHGSSLCGMPKLALSPIPPSVSLTKTPQPGQFPYVAVVKFGPNICSASIIDAYWLVTSARCFVESRNASRFKIYVGEYDLAVSEVHTHEHACSNIILSGNTSRDIALVELADPIDFTNQYVNDMCLFRSEQLSELKLDETQFVVGWGKYGRQPLISESLPRYVPGMPLTDRQCTTAWGIGNYTIGKDFCFMSASNDKNVPCSGDEGSPLLVQAHANPLTGTSDRLVQIGVYYKRDSICSPIKPGLFASIAQYSQWISEKIACVVPGAVYPSSCPQS